MHGQRPNGRQALSLRGQWFLLAAALVIGTATVGWLALGASAPSAIWQVTSVAGAMLAVVVASSGLAWRLVVHCRGILDQLVQALDRVAGGDLSQRLDEGGSAEMRRVAGALN